MVSPVQFPYLVWGTEWGGDLFLVNTGDPATGQANPTVAANATGQAFIAWEDDHAYGGPGEDPDPTGVRGHAFLADRVFCMSGRPGRVISERSVDLPRPRDLEITYSAAFTDIVNELRRLIARARSMT